MRQISDERFKQFLQLTTKYYSWEIIMRDAGIDKISDKGEQYEITCPFHDDKRPSMRLTKSNGVYHCFSCGRKGTYTKFLWELGGKAQSYSEYCEQVLKAHPAMQAELHFSSLFITENSLDPEFEVRRTFNRESFLGGGLPITSLAQQVRSMDDTWENLVLTLTLLQQNTATDDIMALLKRRTINVQTPREKISLLDLI